MLPPLTCVGPASYTTNEASRSATVPPPTLPESCSWVELGLLELPPSSAIVPLPVRLASRSATVILSPPPCTLKLPLLMNVQGYGPCSPSAPDSASSPPGATVIVP